MKREIRKEDFAEFAEKLSQFMGLAAPYDTLSKDVLNEAVAKIKGMGFAVVITDGEEYNRPVVLCSILLPNDLITVSESTWAKSVLSAIIRFIDYLPFEHPQTPTT